MARIATKRLQKELSDLQSGGCPAGCDIVRADDLQEWVMSVSVLGESVYAGETFGLRFKFSSGYPIDSPEVTFMTTEGYSPPVHPHVYSNGHICASILSTQWSPVLNVASVTITLQSMLASCKKKELPPDNDRYVKSAPKNPKLTRWDFHDDDV